MVPVRPAAAGEGYRNQIMKGKFPGCVLYVTLPVTAVVETYRYYEPVAAQVSAAQAEARGEEILTEYLHTLVDPYGTVSSTLCTSRQTADGLLVTLSAECVEQIGQTVPIYTEPTEEPGG